MTTSAPVKSSGSRATSACTQRVLGACQDGRRRAIPTISPTRSSSASAWMTLVPTLPVAPVTTTCKLMQEGYPTWVAASAMKALTWHGAHDVRVDTVPDPSIEQPTDAIIKVTSPAICGSDLPLYEVLGPYIDTGDVLGHEPMGIVEEVGAEVTHIKPGDRVVIPFNVSCGHCHMCDSGLQSQCETTQVREYNTGAALLGYTKLYGQVPGGQAEYLRVPQAHYGPIKVPEGPPDDRFLYLSDVLPTAWQAVEYANIPPDGSVVVLGLGPI